MAHSHNLIALDDLHPEQLVKIIERAQDMAEFWAQRRMPQCLAGKHIALVVNDTGWRNTAAFDLGIQAMGGICVQPLVHWDTREELPDLAAYIDNWFDGIVTRTPSLPLLRQLAGYSRHPIINARTQQNHPCETLGDLAFYLHRHGKIDGLRIAVVSPKSNILGSWIEAAKALPISVTQIFPEQWHDQEARSSVARFRCSTNMSDLIESDLIVTDCWPANGESSELLSYQVTTDWLDQLSPQAEFIPCPPVSRGKEVSAEAMKHSICRVTAAKAFLLHTQNAILEWAFQKS